MHEYDEAVLRCFLENQGQLFPEDVAENMEEAEAFLEDSMAVVVDDIEEVIEYFDEMGVDTDGMSDDEIEQQSEVFKMPDGRYLVVNA